MTYSFTKTIATILLTILLFLLGISGLYGGYHFLFAFQGEVLPIEVLSDNPPLFTGLFFLMVLGFLPLFLALWIFRKHLRARLY